MRALQHPIPEQLDMPTLLFALGDPTRLRIVHLLDKRAELTCSCCLDVEMAKSALSHHLKVLREAGVIRVRLEGKNRYISLRREELESRFPGVLEAVLGNLHGELGEVEVRKSCEAADRVLPAE